MTFAALAPAAALACCVLAATAEAKPAHTTKYTYYTVGGGTAQEVYRAMLKRGPRVNGAKAYASTAATSSQDGKLMQAKSCRIEDYRLKIDFVIRLPKIKNEKLLPPADRSRWQQFSQFLKKHEETHRAIWLACAAGLERKVRALKAKTCEAADAKAAALWDAARAACARKHDAFDAAEQKKLMRHPFVKLVYQRSGRTTHAAKAP